MELSDRKFLDLFTDSKPALNVKSHIDFIEEVAITVLIKNKLRDRIDKEGSILIENLCKDERLKDFSDFYTLHDGLELAIPMSPKNCLEIPLLEFVSTSNLIKFNQDYLKGGKWDWIIDLNKTKSLYREGNSWLAFAKVHRGPACLTIFLDGENAGCIYYATPQPPFNILKPIAKSFNHLLDRIVKDPAAFFRLIRSNVTIRKKDGQNYGYQSVEYIHN